MLCQNRMHRKSFSQGYVILLTKSSRSRDRTTLPRKISVDIYTITHPRVLKHFRPKEGDWGNESLITPKFHIPSIFSSREILSGSFNRL